MMIYISGLFFADPKRTAPRISGNQGAGYHVEEIIRLSNDRPVSVEREDEDQATAMGIATKPQRINGKRGQAFRRRHEKLTSKRRQRIEMQYDLC